MDNTPTFGSELEALINKYSKENASNTPDFILANYLDNCLEVFNSTMQDRARWYGDVDPDNATESLKGAINSPEGSQGDTTV